MITLLNNDITLFLSLGYNLMLPQNCLLLNTNNIKGLTQVTSTSNKEAFNVNPPHPLGHTRDLESVHYILCRRSNFWHFTVFFSID